MSDASVASSAVKRGSWAKQMFWVLFILMALFVVLTRERSMLEPQSFLHQRYAPFKWLMFAHGIPGALALALGVFQFSNRFRQRHLQMHRVMGRVYVACVVIAAPVAILVSIKLPLPTLFAASVIQAGGWIVATGTALYCVRLGKIQQHREWMMRSYPFAMVFVATRIVLSIPAVQAMGLFGIVTVVWTSIALACVLPSFVIAWQALVASKKTAKAPA